MNDTYRMQISQTLKKLNGPLEFDLIVFYVILSGYKCSTSGFEGFFIYEMTQIAKLIFFLCLKIKLNFFKL